MTSDIIVKWIALFRIGIAGNSISTGTQENTHNWLIKNELDSSNNRERKITIYNDLILINKGWKLNELEDEYVERKLYTFSLIFSPIRSARKTEHKNNMKKKKFKIYKINLAGGDLCHHSREFSLDLFLEENMQKMEKPILFHCSFICFYRTNTLAFGWESVETNECLSIGGCCTYCRVDDKISPESHSSTHFHNPNYFRINSTVHQIEMDVACRGYSSWNFYQH